MYARNRFDDKMSHAFVRHPLLPATSLISFLPPTIVKSAASAAMMMTNDASYCSLLQINQFLRRTYFVSIRNALLPSMIYISIWRNR